MTHQHIVNVRFDIGQTILLAVISRRASVEGKKLTLGIKVIPLSKCSNFEGIHKLRKLLPVF